jgi:hypothetical protein
MACLFPRLQAKIDRYVRERYHEEMPLTKNWVHTQVKDTDFDYYGRLMRDEAGLRNRATHSSRYDYIFELLVDHLIDKTISQENGWLYIGGGGVNHRWVHQDWASVEQLQTNWRLRYQSKREDQRALERAAVAFVDAAHQRGCNAEIIRNAAGEAVDVTYEEVIAA